ncbi:glycosyltransferase family 9 protein [Curtobacterium ammoniigenes]|uniref:glycosyltransferase family 9 protein n=1 Tax=Curtobacterium ammoniigenes TaxID=395387 RepID=UPI000832E8E5|nr:glycosyltransferase family 9 protein [Curtobacterium ammoniigenes]
MPALAQLPPSDGRPDLLVLRAIKLGDVLVGVPALRALRRSFPDHRIALATTAWLAPLVELLPVDVHIAQHGLDHPIAAPDAQIDIAVNLHGSGPESADLIEALGAHREIRHARPDEAPGSPHPPWVRGVHERARWADLMTAHGIPANADDVAIAVPSTPPMVGDAAIVHVGAFYGARHWPVDRFAAVARSLAQNGEHVVVTGGAEDRDRALAVARQAGLSEDSVLAGRADLTAFAALIAAARAVVTVDTGAAHLASAYGRPSVVLFGPALPEEWGPPASGPHVVLTDARVRRGDVFASDPDPALLAVTPDDVLEALAGVIDRPTLRDRQAAGRSLDR